MQGAQRPKHIEWMSKGESTAQRKRRPTAAVSQPPVNPAARTFIALWPEGNARQQLTRLAESLAVKAGGKPVCAVNLHLTMVYIGKTDAVTLAKLYSVITMLKQPTLNLQLDLVSLWKRNEIIVATTRNCPVELVSVAQSLRQTLDEAGIAYDDQHAFKPHVTLVRRVRSGNLPDLTIEIAWTATRLSLVQSLQTLKGNTYRTLVDCRLAGARQS